MHERRATGPAVLVCQTVPAATELALGIVSEAELGPLVVVGAGGVLVELLADLAIALPPVWPPTSHAIEALDVNPLICGPDGAVAVGALAVPHRTIPPVS